MDHGETPRDCLKREFAEEIGITNDFKIKLLEATDAKFLPSVV
jgi:8-oxo-dGTP pyrophosphatase MutT (NUDIX family)